MSLMNFEIISEITGIETIAVGSRIRDLARLRRMYGKGHWRKLKGVATVRLRSGEFVLPSCIGTKLMALGAKT